MMKRVQTLLNQILQFLDNRLAEVYSSPNRWLRMLIMPLYYLRRLVMLPQGSVTFQIYLLTGRAAGMDRDITVGYLYQGKNLKYIAGMLFHEGRYEIKELGRCRFWQQAEAAASLAQQADLVIVERNTLLSWKPRTGEWLVSPTGVRMVLTMDPTRPWEGLARSFKKHERNIRRFQRAGYTYEISTDKADFDFFYERMYLPFANNRHKENPIIAPYHDLYGKFKDGFLLFILDKDGNRIAGDLDYTMGEVFYPLSCGILDGEQKYLDEGALSALYYYAIQVSHQKGYRRSDVCDTSPFINDGIYQYKRRWGYEPQRELWNAREWLFWVPDGSPAAIRWLEENPVVEEFAQRSRQPALPALHPQTTGD